MTVENAVKELNRLSIGFDRNETIGLNVLPGYYSISNEKFEQLKKSAGHYCSLMRKINTLYKGAVANNDKLEVFWIVLEIIGGPGFFIRVCGLIIGEDLFLFYNILI